MPLKDLRFSLFDRAKNRLMHEDDGDQTYDHSIKRGNRFVGIR